MARARIVPRDGTAWMVGLLILSLAVLIALAWQALDAARGHRDAAQDVLRDYARLAADELASRCHQGIGYYGAIPALQQLVLQGERPGGRPLADPGTIALSGDRRLRRALSLFATSLRFDRARGTLESAGAPVAPAVAAWLTARLSDSTALAPVAGQPVAPFHTVIGGLEHRAFVVPPTDPASPVYGLLLDARTIGAQLGESLTATPLLPASLAAEDLGDDAVAFELLDAAGAVIFATRATPSRDPYAPAVTYAFGDSYLAMLDGWTARVGLDPTAAPKLVIGGLPRSRLPLLGGLIALGALLLIAALVQLQRARKLTRLRADFVAEVSHELRTPLTQIRMFTETLLLGRVRNQDEARRSLEIVDREARRLSRLVENILQFARRERGAILLDPRPQPLTPIVRSVLDEMAPMAAAGDVRIASEIDDEATAEIDDAALKQVLINLLDNAFKYGPSGQTVRVILERDGDERNGDSPAGAWRLSVEDEGPGVPKAERDRIFESYRRLDRDRRAAIAGTGIGLAVVRDLIDRSGGRCWAASGTRGARFVIALPACEAPAVRTAAAEATA